MPSKSQAQHDFMQKACDNAAFAEKAKISQSVACEFIEADKKAGLWQETDRKAIEDFVACTTDQVKKNIEIISAGDAKLPYFLHLTLEKKPKYVPRIGTRQGSTEDRTVTRVTVADTLIGCYVGYASFIDQFFQQNAYMGNKGIDFNNGLYLRKLPFKYALKPNSKLVFDQKKSNEHWLVNYSKETAEYESEEIGKLFISAMSAMPDGKKYPKLSAEFFLQVEIPIYLTESIFLEAGYYVVRLENINNLTHNTKRLVSYSEVTKAEFDVRKQIVAANLTIEEKKEYKISAFGVSDIDAFVQFRQNTTSPERASFLQSTLFKNNGKEGYLLWAGDDVAGEVFLEKNEKSLYISLLSIHPDYQNEGLAKKLLGFIKLHAEMLDVKTIELTILPENQRAFDVFSKSGFVKTGDYGDSYRMTYLLKNIVSSNTSNFYKKWASHHG